MSEKKSTGWSNVRRRLEDWSKPALIALLKDLYDASPDNRDFFFKPALRRKKATAPLWKTTGARSWTNFFRPAVMANSNWPRRARPSALIAELPATWQEQLT